MLLIFQSPLFHIALTITSFYLASVLAKKIKHPIANPLLLATLLAVPLLYGLGISYETYMNGGQFIVEFIGPATAILGLSIYRQRRILKEQFLPIVLGCVVGSVLSLVFTYFLSNLLMLQPNMTSSLLPKSVTTAIALDLSVQLGGMKSITLMSVVLSGIGGAIINPIIIKMFGLTDQVAIGVAMGTSSHAIGTSRAIEMGEVEGAVSGVAMGIAGIATVIAVLFI